MKKRVIWFVSGICLVAAGLFLVVPELLQTRETQLVPKVSAAMFTDAPAEQPAPDPGFVVLEGKPVRIRIPSLGIDLPVAEGRYNATTQKWTLSNDKAHYAVNTPLANNVAGNTFIYGHNRKEVFRSLSKIRRGDVAIVTTDNGHEFYYAFEGALETTPDDRSLFGYQGAPILTVQTCSGLWNQNRQLFTFSLKEVR